jgi:hypothetical protein
MARAQTADKPRRFFGGVFRWDFWLVDFDVGVFDVAAQALA